MSEPSRNEKLLRIGAAQIRLLERLCNASGVSGDEQEVRAIVLEQVQPQVQQRPGGQVKVDALGNVLVTLPGQGPQGSRRPRVMLAAHMDEVGLMITQEEEKGIYRFETVGGVDVRQLAGKPVWIGREHVPGVIGAKPIHLTEPDELKRVISLETLRIDTGLGSNSKVKVGDRAVFAASFTRAGPSLRARALDNRLGVATLIELVKNAPPHIDLLAAFTVQEEVGLRGAKVAAYALDPDLALALDATPAYDLPVLAPGEPVDQENTAYNTRLGAGPALYIADSGTLSDPRLVRYLADTAQAHNIPYQFRQPGGGTTDASIIHRQRAGIPSASVSVPARYTHTSAGIARLQDWENTLALVHAALSGLSLDILAQER